MTLMRLILFSFLMVLFVASFGVAYGQVNYVNLDKSSYQEGDRVIISGNVEYTRSNPYVVIQVFSPDGALGPYFGQLTAETNGDFSTSFTAGGANWPVSGVYQLRVFHTSTVQKDIHFSLNPVTETVSPSDSTTPPPTRSSEPTTPPPPTRSSEPTTPPPPSPPPTRSSEPPTTPPPSSEPPTTPPPPSSEPTPSSKPMTSEIPTGKMALKSKIANFPAINQSPQHYIDRYNNEPNYKTWFDSVFPGHSIEDVVTYSETPLSNYPDNTKTPIHYIDRYHSEPNYKSWFHSVIGDKTLYEVLGFSESHATLSWFKHNAGLWSSDQIDKSVFLSNIEFLVENNILKISESTSISQIDSEPTVPKWVKNTIQGWHDDLVSESEFLLFLEYMIQKEIIILNSS